MEPHYNDEMKIMTFFKWHSIEVYLFSPVWQLQSGVIQNHYFHMSKRVLLKCRAQILHNEVSLHFWCPAHSLKWEVCEEPIGGLVLPGYAPDRNTFLSISFQKPEKVVITWYIPINFPFFYIVNFKECDQIFIYFGNDVVYNKQCLFFVHFKKVPFKWLCFYIIKCVWSHYIYY